MEINYDDCSHPEIVEIDGQNICKECAEILGNQIDHEEVLFYNKNTVSRCHEIKTPRKGIWTNEKLKNSDIPEKIIALANTKFLKVVEYTGKKTNRKCVVAACIFKAYQDSGQFIELSKLQEIFDINQPKKISAKINEVELACDTPKRKFTNAIDLIPSVLDKFGYTNEYKRSCMNEIERIYNNVYNKSNALKRAKPQSVAAGLVYYYLRFSNIDVTRAKFVEISGLTANTLNKITKEINRLMETTVKF